MAGHTGGLGPGTWRANNPTNGEAVRDDGSGSVIGATMSTCASLTVNGVSIPVT